MPDDLRRGSDRSVPIKLYEPINVLKPITDGLGIVDGPPVRLSFGLGSVPFPTRMVVVRLSDGGL